jgi:NADPH-dependent 2,4-dienoyl-CoA reductase/sulfur reductase-like enzyme
VKPDVVAVGGGLAAQRFCETLRRNGYEGPIRLVAGEPERPYDRPPLSKEFLAGSAGADDLALRPARWYADNAVELLLGERAAGLEPDRRRVRLEGGRRLKYDDLLIATGSEPRRLPQFDGYANVHYLRTLADAAALRAALTPGARIAIVGAGFIGQEVAATARRLGAEVTIVEALAAPLERIVGSVLGRWFADLHRAEGVEVLLRRTVIGLKGNECVEALVLDDGRRIACDAVVVGVGVKPATGWLQGSGLSPGGVAVDPEGRTAIPRVYAAGDAALAFDPAAGTHVRSEHWEAAARQGAAAARALLGLPAEPCTPSTFWSDQYGVRIQHVGNGAGADSVELDGDPDTRSFTAVYRRRSLPVAALLVGRPRELPEIRRRLARHVDHQEQDTGDRTRSRNAPADEVLLGANR